MREHAARVTTHDDDGVSQELCGIRVEGGWVVGFWMGGRGSFAEKNAHRDVCHFGGQHLQEQDTFKLD